MTTVTKLSFRTTKPQTYHDDWRGTDRICRFVGACYSCGRRTYAFDDGENDPRGALGDHSGGYALDADSYGYSGPDVPLCAICGNEEGPYMRAVEYAKRKVWTVKVEASAEA